MSTISLEATGFYDCILRAVGKQGRCTIKCKLGLWSVTARSRSIAVVDAYALYRQYKSDGEYHELIGGPTPNEVMISRMKAGVLDKS